MMTAVGAVLVFVLSACSGTPDEPLPAADSPPAVSISGRSVDLGTVEVSHLQVDPSYVVWAQSDDASAPTSVVVMSRRDDSKRVVYESEHRAGKIDWVALEAGHVLFTDEDRVPTIGDEGTRWVLIAVDLSTGKRTILRRSPGQARTWPAVPVGNDGSFVWTEQRDRHDVRKGLVAWRWAPGMEAPRPLAGTVRSAVVRPFAEGVLATRFGVVDRHGNYALDLVVRSGRSVRPVTTSGLVLDFDVHDGTAVWSERQAGRASGDPRWIYRVNGGPELDKVLVYEGLTMGNVRVGSSFVAWWNTAGRVVVVREGSDPETIQQRRVWVPARMDADGDDLVYATRRSGRTRLHLVTVTP